MTRPERLLALDPAAVEAVLTPLLELVGHLMDQLRLGYLGWWVAGHRRRGAEHEVKIIGRGSSTRTRDVGLRLVIVS